MTMYSAEEQQEHRERLVQALTSGRFEQAKEALRTRTGWCCLGVGCEIAFEDWKEHGRQAVDPWLGWEGPFNGSGNGEDEDYYSFYTAGTSKSTVLPESVRRYFGFKTANGELARAVRWGSRDCNHLTELNDAGAPFGFIAGVIATGNVLLEEEGS